MYPNRFRSKMERGSSVWRFCIPLAQFGTAHLFCFATHRTRKGPHTRVQAPKSARGPRNCGGSQPAHAPAPPFTLGSQEANLRTRRGCHHNQFCRQPHHLQGTLDPASPVKDTPRSPFEPIPATGDSFGASHRHAPQARTLYWAATSSRASFMPSRGYKYKV